MKNKRKRDFDVKNENVKELLKDSEVLKVKKEIELTKKNFVKCLLLTGKIQDEVYRTLGTERQLLIPFQ